MDEQTQHEKEYNQMRDALLKIALNYWSAEDLKEHAEEEYGLGYHEALEMAYENIQQEAKTGLNGIVILGDKTVKI